VRGRTRIARTAILHVQYTAKRAVSALSKTSEERFKVMLDKPAAEVRGHSETRDGMTICANAAPVSKQIAAVAALNRTNIGFSSHRTP
jgi:hypothetical protein